MLFIRNFKHTVSFFAAITFFTNIVNWLSNNSNFICPVNPSSIVPYTRKSSILKDENDYVSIFEYYKEFIESSGVRNVNYDIMHDALALDHAQNNKKNTENYIDDLEYIYVNNYIETKHINKAVSITICTNFNKLVVDAIILKYFSRNVYYEIVSTINGSKMLFGEFHLGNITSLSYGVVKSDSLGLNLVVV